MAPPPPPSRYGRSSMDGHSPSSSRRPSGEMGRRSVDVVRRGSTASSLSQVEHAIIPEPQSILPLSQAVLPSEPEPAAHDVLADLDALQREIDALRGSGSHLGSNVM